MNSKRDTHSPNKWRDELVSGQGRNRNIAASKAKPSSGLLFCFPISATRLHSTQNLLPSSYHLMQYGCANQCQADLRVTTRAQQRQPHHLLDKSTERMKKKKYKTEYKRRKTEGEKKERRPTLSNSLSAPKYADCACVQWSCRNGTPTKKKITKTNKRTGIIIKTKQWRAYFHAKLLRKKTKYVKTAVNQEEMPKYLRLQNASVSRWLLGFWGFVCFWRNYKGFFLRGCPLWCLGFFCSSVFYVWQKFFSWKRSGPSARALMTFCGLTCQMFEAPYQDFFFRGKWVAEPLDDSVLFHSEVSDMHTVRTTKLAPFVYWHVGYVCIYIYLCTICAHPRSPYILHVHIQSHTRGM